MFAVGKPSSPVKLLNISRFEMNNVSGTCRQQREFYGHISLSDHELAIRR
jgi:hypothetical protein